MAQSLGTTQRCDDCGTELGALDRATRCPNCGGLLSLEFKPPAMRGKKRCRLHGGKSTGPRTAEGIERIRRARTVHGRYSAEMIALRREMAQWARLARQSIQKVD